MHMYTTVYAKSTPYTLQSELFARTLVVVHFRILTSWLMIR